MPVDFTALQQKVFMQYSTVESTRKQMNQIVEIYKSQDDYDEYVRRFATFVREGIKEQTFKDADSFYVDPDIGATILNEDLRHDALGFCRNGICIYEGRYVYPVKDTHGDVMGWCGYDLYTDPKYLDSKNYGYVAKKTTLYGMEKLPEYYTSREPVFFVEGIVCCLYLRQEKFNALAFLGSHVSPYVLEIVKRFGSRAVVIPDSDEAGNKLKKQISYYCKQARIHQSKIAKDVDDSKTVNPDIVSDLKVMGLPFAKLKYFT